MNEDLNAETNIANRIMSVFGTTNSTPNSTEKDQLPDLIICKRIIFKRIPIHVELLANQGICAMFNYRVANGETLTAEESAQHEYACNYVHEHTNDSFGHWWVEIYKTPNNYEPSNLQSSYGWWPEEGSILDLSYAVSGVPGLLNRGKSYDPYASYKAEDDSGSIQPGKIAFHPVIQKDKKTEEELIEEIEKFAQNFEKEHTQWGYPAIMGNEHCQSFQEKMMRACGLDTDPKAHNIIYDKTAE